MVGYVGLSKDFVSPGKEMDATDKDSKIWDMSMEEVVGELEKQGLIDTSTKQLLSTSGVCSEAYKYNGAEIYWWDLDNLKENSDEYKAYKSLKEEGYIDLWGSGNIMSPKRNGPFAILLTQYEGDANALEKAFTELGKE
jgi:DNA-binding transcriptional regulator YhcF (GntR family)